MIRILGGAGGSELKRRSQLVEASTLIFISSSKSVAVSSSLPLVVVVKTFSVFLSFVAFGSVVGAVTDREVFSGADVGAVAVAIASSPRASIELETFWSLVTDVGTAVVIVVVSEDLSEVFVDSV